MKTVIFLLTFAFLSCSKDDNEDSNNTTPTPENVESRVVTLPNSGFSFKEYFQTPANETNRKGIIILAHGNGGTHEDATLNDQCVALAAKGYVAITTSYRNVDNLEFTQQGGSFLTDIESVIAATTNTFAIARNKVIIGGLSRGGNLTFSLILPGQLPPDVEPISGIKGAILECSGGDNWKGANVKFPVLYMSNISDPVLGMNDANDFKNGLLDNANNGVSSLSQTLIINSNGHCTNADQYKNFITTHIDSFF